MSKTTLKDDFAILEPAADVQKAYDESNGTNGQYPWTIDRHSAAMSLGCTIMNGVFGTELKGLVENSSYPNSLRDVIIVLWLCSLEPEEVTRINARLDITTAIQTAFAWAETEGLTYGSKKFMDGLKTLTTIVFGIFKSFYSVEEERSPGAFKKNGTNTKAHGKSGSPSRPRKRPEKQPAT